MNEVEILRRKLEREKSTRRQAELLLESKSLELYVANEELKRLNAALQQDLERKSRTLERQKVRIQQLVDDANDIIYICSPEGIFRYVNPVAMRLMEYSQEELIGKHYSELVHPDHLQSVTAFYAKQVTLEESSYLEFPVLTKSGKQLWLGQKVNMVKRNGEIIRLNAIARDITDQKLSEKKVADLYLRLKTILENLQAGVLVEDEHRKIVAVNQKFCDIFGIPVSPELLIGVDCADSAEQSKHLFASPEAFTSRIEILLQKQEIATHDSLEMVNGTILERDYIPIFKGGIYNGHLWHYEDVTERKKIEEKIRRSEEKYRSIIENMELGIMEVDAKGVIIKPYPRFCKMTGYEEKELIGKIANEIFLPEEFELTMKAQDEKRLTGQPDTYEVKLLKKNGEPLWVLIGGAPIMDEKGVVTGSIGIHFDLTEHKLLQKELEIARFEAEKARDAEKDFLANMSHEIRNPIHSIIGMINLLYDTHLSAEQLDYVKTVKYSSEILMALVSDILDISKIVEGKMELSPQQFNLKELIEGVSRTIEIRLLEKPVTFGFFIDHYIPDAVIGDSTFINQILLNILGNSVKFTEKGTIQLYAYLQALEGEVVWVKIKIEDTGIGIEPEKLAGVFERFSQAGKMTKSKYGGTGLGLPITKQLIELQGGTIKVESTFGKGSTFFIELPFQKAALLDPKKLEKQAPIAESEVENATTCILIVEDNPVNRRYLESILQKWQFSFLSAGDGLEALQILNHKKVDLILMDIRMPNMDGYETTVRLRSLKNNPNHAVPIIALTASALLDEREKVLRVGMNYHLTKPFTPEQLLSTIRLFSHNQPIVQPAFGVESFEFSATFDTTELQELYGGSLEHIQLLFDIFIKNTPQELLNLKQAMLKNERSAMAEIAHKIKPTFKMVGLGHVEMLAKELEKACKEATTTKKLQDVYDRFHAATQRAVVLVQEECEKIQQFTKSKKQQDALPDC